MAVKGEVVVARPSRRVSRRFSLRVNVVQGSRARGEEGGGAAVEDSIDGASYVAPRSADWHWRTRWRARSWRSGRITLLPVKMRFPTRTHLLRRGVNKS